MEVVDVGGDPSAAERIASLAREWYRLDVETTGAPTNTCGAWTAWIEGNRSGAGVVTAAEIAKAQARAGDERVCAFIEAGAEVGVMIVDAVTARLSRFAYDPAHADEVMAAMYDWVEETTGRRPSGKVDAPGMVRTALGMGGGRMPLVARRRARARREGEGAPGDGG